MTELASGVANASRSSRSHQPGAMLARRRDPAYARAGGSGRNRHLICFLWVVLTAASILCKGLAVSGVYESVFRSAAPSRSSYHLFIHFSFLSLYLGALPSSFSLFPLYLPSSRSRPAFGLGVSLTHQGARGCSVLSRSHTRPVPALPDPGEGLICILGLYSVC